MKTLLGLLSAVAVAGTMSIAGKEAVANQFKDIPQCPDQLVEIRPQCAVLGSLDQDGNLELCFCGGKNIKNSRAIPFEDPVVVKGYDLKIAKIKPTDDSNPDPCITVTQNNQTHRVCW